MANEHSESVHSLSPKIFFKNHKEGKEKFTEVGMGIQYKIGKEKGLNFRISTTSNLDYGNELSLQDMELSWKMCKSPSFQIIPFIGTSSFSHIMEKNENVTIYSHKSNAEFGFGFKWKPSRRFQPSIKIGVLKDLYNTLTYFEKMGFSGASYSNPWGGKFTIAAESQFENNNSFDLSAYYYESSHKCYRGCGSELTFNWRF